MEKRRLGVSDILVNPIGIGCWAYGGGEYWGEQNQSDVNEVVHSALDLDINLFDTAEMYNDGASETALGKALKGKRNEAVICSKVSPSNAKPDILRMHCEASLKRLDTDYIDIYMLHWPINSLSVKHFTSDADLISNPPSVQAAFDTLMKLKEEGKIRRIGISNFGASQISEAIMTGAEIIADELPYNIMSRAIEKEIVPCCIENNISIIGSMTLQQGLLAGIFSQAADVPPHQAHSRHFNHERGAGTSRHEENGAEEEIFEALGKLRMISKELGIHMAQLAIAWLISKPWLGCSLVGSRNLSELKANVEAGFICPGKDIIREIDSISEPVLTKLGYNPDYYENVNNSRIK